MPANQILNFPTKAWTQIAQGTITTNFRVQNQTKGRVYLRRAASQPAATDQGLLLDHGDVLLGTLAEHWPGASGSMIWAWAETGGAIAVSHDGDAWAAPALSGIADLALDGRETFSVDVSGNATGTVTHWEVRGASWMEIDDSGVMSGTPPNKDINTTVDVVAISPGGEAPQTISVSVTRTMRPAWTQIVADSVEVVEGWTPPAAPDPSAPDNPAPSNTAASVIITPLTNDLWVYDVGAARGQNSASLPISGTATDNGATIHARVVRDDTLAPVTDWQEVDTVASGAWSGTVACPASQRDLRIEVAQAADTVLSPANKRYVAGDVVTMFGQSWFQRIFNFAGVDPFTANNQYIGNNGTYSVNVPGQVQAIAQGFEGTGAMGNARREIISDDAIININTVRFANAWAEMAPGRRLCLIVQARGATGISDLMDDTNASVSDRNWVADDLPVYNLGKTDSREPGTVVVDWYQAPSTLAEDTNDVLSLFMFSEDAAGNAVQSTAAAGTAQTFTGPTGTVYGFDRSLQDLYTFGANATQLAVAGPHRHEPASIERNNSSDPANWTVDTVQTVDTFLTKAGAAAPGAIGRERIRLGYEFLSADARVDYTGLKLQTIECWGDTAHPAATSNGLSADGDLWWEQSVAINLLGMLGLDAPILPADQPRVSGIEYGADYVDVSFENDAGPVSITTTREVRGVAQAAGRAAHQADVAGFSVLGYPASDVTIVGGKARIALGHAATLNDTFIEFGRGTGGGQLGLISDIADRYWMNYPGLRDESVPDYGEGKQIIPAIGPAKAADIPVTGTPPSVAPGSVIKSAADSRILTPRLDRLLYGTYAAESVVLTSGTVAMRVLIPDMGELNDAGNQIMSMASGYSLRPDTRNSKLQWIASSTGATLLRTANGAYTAGAWHEVVLGWDAVAQTSTIAVDGTVLITEAYARGGQPLETIELLNFASQTDGVQMSHFKLFDSYNAGLVPSGMPLLTISGGPTTLNAHPWKTGADFTGSDT